MEIISIKACASWRQRELPPAEDLDPSCLLPRPLPQRRLPQERRVLKHRLGVLLSLADLLLRPESLPGQPPFARLPKRDDESLHILGVRHRRPEGQPSVACAGVNAVQEDRVKV
ncbi:hypothetical protein LBMAG42_56110 [Deltaproteobacteria bacterium]|nr:hypothetical protein LBMAG42_56110 [Deltaproteobacteria bacterium]